MNNFQGLYDVRDYKESDKSFILATFLRGVYHGDSWFSYIPRSIFMDNYKHIADQLLAKSLVKVACLREDPDVILGYSILSNNYHTIHWVHVKKAWRKQGIARSLLPQFPSAVTHLSAVGKSLVSKFPGVVFNPFLV